MILSEALTLWVYFGLRGSELWYLEEHGKQRLPNSPSSVQKIWVPQKKLVLRKKIGIEFQSIPEKVLVHPIGLYRSRCY